MGVHCFVAITAAVIFVIVPIVVLSILFACVDSTEITVLEGGSEGQVITNGVTCADAELPRGVETELIDLIVFNDRVGSCRVSFTVDHVLIQVVVK